MIIENKQKEQQEINKNYMVNSGIKEKKKKKKRVVIWWIYIYRLEIFIIVREKDFVSIL